MAMLVLGRVKSIHTGKLTWNQKMEVWKMVVLFSWVILRVHVNFQGCTGFATKMTVNHL